MISPNFESPVYEAEEEENEEIPDEISRLLEQETKTFQRRMGDPPPQLDSLQRLRKTLTDFLQQGRATPHTS